jgi:Ca-activated chloride channel family protein
MFLNHLFVLFFALLTVSPCLQASSLVEPSSGDFQFRIQDDNDSSRQVITGLHINSHVDIHISGLVASVELTQTFENPTQEWVEGRYVFPLPENAAVNAMRIDIGERSLKAVIKEKTEAKKIYKAAKASGKKAALLDQQRPNLFSQKVANIGPGEKITVHLRYLQTLEYQHDTFSLRFPMTLTPRYIPGSSEVTNTETFEPINTSINQKITLDDQGWGWSPATTAVPDAHLITPPMTKNNGYREQIINPISMSLQLDAGLPLATINSTYHDVSITKKGNIHHIHFANNQVSMDRDFLLTWKPTDKHAPKAAIFNETVDGDDYSLIMLMPPKGLGATKVSIPKEMIFIIDTSGSMGGTSIKQAKAGLEFALKQLNPRDKFNIIEFNSVYSTLFPQSVLADTSNIQQALNFIQRLKASGGTEILPALNAAFKQAHDENYLKQIVFITDGSVGNEQALFTHIHQHLGDARLFTVGIGSAPNFFFMRKAAQFGRGTYTAIGDLQDVDQSMSDLFRKITQPVMRDIVISNDQNDSHNLEVFPQHIPDLYEGEPLVIHISKDYELDTIRMKGRFLQQDWTQNLSLNNGKHHPGISTLWARKKIESLLDHKVTGEAEEKIKPQVLELALKHQLMSPYTSFVVVDENISRRKNEALKKSAVPNLIPHGQSLQSLNYPQTATPLWLHSLLGLITACLACFFKLKILFIKLLYRFRQQDVSL